MRSNLRRRLTQDEKDAIFAYANEFFGFDINRLLRSEPISKGRSIEATKRYIANLDAAMAKAYSFPNDVVKVVYRGTSMEEVAGWDVGTVRTFKTFLSTSFQRARALLYQKCCVIVIRGSKNGVTAKFVYSPTEEELVLDRGTSLVLKAIRTVKTTVRTWKHPDYPASDIPLLGGEVTLYESKLAEA